MSEYHAHGLKSPIWVFGRVHVSGFVFVTSLVTDLVTLTAAMVVIAVSKQRIECRLYPSPVHWWNAYRP